MSFAKLLALCSLVGCVATQYAGQLDQCALSNAGNPAAIAACQCQISQSFGRDCSWLDGGSGGYLPEAGQDVAADTGVQ